MRALLWVSAVLVSVALGSAGASAQPEPARDSMVSEPRPGTAGGPPGAASRGPYRMPPIGKALADDLHNKLIHFPIVLTLVAAVMVIVARKKPQFEPVAFWLVWVAALSVIPAYFTGKAQEEHFHGKPKEWLAELHEKQGIVIGITQALWVLSLLKTGTRRYAWVIGLLLSIMVLGSGFIGGLLAHGH